MEGANCEPSAVIGASVRVPPADSSYSFCFLLDGDDVSEDARVAEFKTYPRTMVQVSYKPPEPLSAGLHSAQIDYSDSLGTRLTYRWEFVVE